MRPADERTRIADPGPCFACPYLPDRAARFEDFHGDGLSPREYEGLMASGWRKFGFRIFRPVCPACEECRPIRVQAGSFRPGRGQSRSRAAHADLEYRFGEGIADDERRDLINRYHGDQAIRKEWFNQVHSIESYREAFLEGPFPILEIAAFRKGTLVGIMIVDATPNSLSGVYHFYDKSSSPGIGTCLIMELIERARALGKAHAYLGFLVEDCPSMSYKSRYRPCEIMDRDGRWRLRDS